jgi:L-fuculose-phosphate aldolase
MTPALRALSEQVLETAQAMFRTGLVRGTAGNISARDPESGLLAITPSAIPYDKMTLDDIVIIDQEGRIVEGHRKPSTEVPMHTRMYRDRAWVNGVVHTHSMFATTFAILGEPIPAVHYYIAPLGDEIPVAPYATYGSPELAEQVSRTLGDNHRAVLMGNHGALAIGASLAEAFGYAATVELLAELYYRARAVGRPNILSPSELARVAEKLKSYGQDRP